MNIVHICADGDHIHIGRLLFEDSALKSRVDAHYLGTRAEHLFIRIGILRAKSAVFGVCPAGVTVSFGFFRTVEDAKRGNDVIYPVKLLVTCTAAKHGDGKPLLRKLNDTDIRTRLNDSEIVIKLKCAVRKNGNELRTTAAVLTGEHLFGRENTLKGEIEACLIFVGKSRKKLLLICFKYLCCLLNIGNGKGSGSRAGYRIVLAAALKGAKVYSNLSAKRLKRLCKLAVCVCSAKVYICTAVSARKSVYRQL